MTKLLHIFPVGKFSLEFEEDTIFLLQNMIRGNGTTIIFFPVIENPSDLKRIQKYGQ
jgi:hypothetical protein